MVTCPGKEKSLSFSKKEQINQGIDNINPKPSGLRSITRVSISEKMIS